MKPRLTNLLQPASELSKNPMAETTTPLIQTSSLRLEHIVSYGQPSSPGFWYDQPQDEWVLLMQGTATLVFGTKDSVEKLELKAGDSLTIRAHQRHRVEAVSRDAVWVAVHFQDGL